jgi:hypothetical protein
MSALKRATNGLYFEISSCGVFLYVDGGKRRLAVSLGALEIDPPSFHTLSTIQGSDGKAVSLYVKSCVR